MSAKSVKKIIISVVAVILIIGITGYWAWKSFQYPSSVIVSESEKEDCIYMNCNVDFQTKTGMPLLKKFAMFNSGLVSMTRYERDIALIDALSPQSLRVDLFMGESNQEFGNVVTGDKENMVYDFSGLDSLTRLLNEHQVLPYWAWCYIPQPLQENHDYRSGPTDLDAYGKMIETFSAHYKDSDLRLGYQEVYNEPDCNDVFFTGSWEDYIELYKTAAPAIKRGNEDAVVGGPSTAFVLSENVLEDNYAKFLEAVKTQNLPLDFFSFHSYGYADDIYCHRTELIRDMLADDPFFSTTELHMNEMNTIPFPWDYNSVGGKILDSTSMLPHIFNAMDRLLQYPDLTLVHWAQFLDSGVDALGIVDVYGNPRPAYFAFEIYNRMPVNRVYSENNSLAKMLSSADENRASVLLWNPDMMDANTEVTLHNLPFKEGQANVYLLNEEFFDNNPKELTVSQSFSVCNDKPVTLKINLHRNDVVYIEVNNTKEKNISSQLEADIIRTRYYFEDRKSSVYSHYSEKENIAYIGMGESEQGRAVCAVEMKNVSDIFKISTTTYNMQDAKGNLEVRCDYHTPEGYTSAISLSTAARSFDSLPWGTKKTADDVQQLTVSDSAVLDIKSKAPAGWDGKVLITFILENTGKDSSARIQLES